MGEATPPLIPRPNGKVYRPRKIRAIYCEDNYEARCSVIVLGTHDEEAARPLASAEATYRLGNCLFDAIGEQGWWRDGYQHNERALVYDAVRGAAGVRFECEER